MNVASIPSPLVSLVNGVLTLQTSDKDDIANNFSTNPRTFYMYATLDSYSAVPQGATSFNIKLTNRCDSATISALSSDFTIVTFALSAETDITPSVSESNCGDFSYSLQGNFGTMLILADT